MSLKLLTTHNLKTEKGNALGYKTGILHLAPASESGVMNACPFASAGCKAVCLYTAGHGRFDNVKNARINRTKFFKEDRKAFIAQLIVEIKSLVKSAEKNGLIPVIRLNGTSDIPWEELGILEQFPSLTFYDYTKSKARALKWADGLMPSNYHVTFSWSEEARHQDAAREVAAAGGNIAVVFSSKNYPETFLGLPVVDGDETDLRFLDPKGVIVGLSAKGDAKKDKSGFVVQI